MEICVKTVLSSSTPLKFLSPASLQCLASCCSILNLQPGETLTSSPEEHSAQVLCSGCIQITTTEGNFVAVINRAGSLFGEQSIIFDEQKLFIAKATAPSTVIVIPGASLLGLLEDAKEMKFAQALGARLRQSQGVASALSGFEFALRAGLNSGSMEIRKMLPSYKELKPAIHKGATQGELDMSGWSYAVYRLPSAINEIFALVLSVKTINVMNSPNALLGGISTKGRRRTCRMLMPGKAFVLMRPGQSDISDFVSCLCVHTIELLKLRSLLKPIHQTMANLRAAKDAIAAGEERESITKAFLARISTIKDADKEALLSMYKEDLLEQLINICIHRGDYVLYADNIPMEFSECTAADKWEEKVQAATTNLVGGRSSEWESSLLVDIVSSNPTSVVYLLSPYLHLPDTRERILAWAESLNTEDIGCKASDNIDDNAYYVIVDKYFSDHPHEVQAWHQHDAKHGIVTVEEREFTGITVQLLFIDKLLSQDYENLRIDQFLKETIQAEASSSSSSSKRKHVIVNIDYAFGEQAEHVLWSLLNLFSFSVRSVNVMGKAGGLQGQRGDILFPTHFIHERGDIPDFRSIDNSDVDAQVLQSLSQRSVHVGPMVTIPGTLLQNRRTLRLYHSIWASVGLEMEGVYFVQALNKAKVMNIVSPAVQDRFLYYVSDLPLSAGASLARPMSMEELIPPLFAITRLFLVKCFSASSECMPRRESLDSAAEETSRDSLASQDHSLRVFRNACRAIARFKIAANANKERKES